MSALSRVSRSLLLLPIALVSVALCAAVYADFTQEGIPAVPVGEPTDVSSQPLAAPVDYIDPAYPEINSGPDLNLVCRPAQLAPFTGDGTSRGDGGTMVCGATSAAATAAATAYVCPAFKGFLYDASLEPQAICVVGPKPCIREAKVIVLPAYPYTPQSKSSSLPQLQEDGTYCIAVHCSYTQSSPPTKTQKYIYYDCKT